MRPRYNHLYVVAFTVDSDDRDGGQPAEIMRALWQRVLELEQTGEILEAVGVPDETIDRETGVEVEVPPRPRRPQTPRRGRPGGGDAGAR